MRPRPDVRHRHTTCRRGRELLRVAALAGDVDEHVLGQAAQNAHVFDEARRRARRRGAAPGLRPPRIGPCRGLGASAEERWQRPSGPTLTLPQPQPQTQTSPRIDGSGRRGCTHSRRARRAEPTSRRALACTARATLRCCRACGRALTCRCARAPSTSAWSTCPLAILARCAAGATGCACSTRAPPPSWQGSCGTVAASMLTTSRKSLAAALSAQAAPWVEYRVHINRGGSYAGAAVTRTAAPYPYASIDDELKAAVLTTRKRHLAEPHRPPARSMADGRHAPPGDTPTPSEGTLLPMATASLGMPISAAYRAEGAARELTRAESAPPRPGWWRARRIRLESSASG